MPGIFAFMGWDPQTPLRGRKGGFTPPYSYKYLFTGIRYNLRNAIKNGDVVKKFWNLLFLIPKTYKKHGKVVSYLDKFLIPETARDNCDSTMKFNYSKKQIAIKAIIILVLIFVSLWMTLSEVESWNRSPVVTSGNISNKFIHSYLSI